MQTKCPYKQLPEWKLLVDSLGENKAMRIFLANNEEVPTMEEVQTIINSSSVNFQFKTSNIVLSNLPKIQQWETNKSVSNEVLWKKIQELGIPKEQLALLKDSEGNNIEEKLTNFIANYSYTIEINTAKEKKPIGSDGEYFDENGRQISKSEYDNLNKDRNTQYYSNLTVPGGTNYTENEIAIPGVDVKEEPKGVPIKPGVAELFESNPELASIATPQLYSQYLDTIFPDSKVKDIVYHGTSNLEKVKTEGFSKSKLKTGEGTNLQGAGFYFAKFKQVLSSYAKGEKGGFVQTVVNLKNPLQERNFPEFLERELNEKNVSLGNVIEVGQKVDNWLNKNNKDGVIWNQTSSFKQGTAEQETTREKLFGTAYNKTEKTLDVEHYSVTEPEQIHILGGKQDIEGFKKWIKNNTKTVRKRAITPSIKGHAQFATDNGIGWFRSDDKDKVKRVSLGKELEYRDSYVKGNRFKKYEVLNENKNVIGDIIIESRGSNIVILHPNLTITGKGYGKDLYKFISSTFNVEVQEWNEGAISNSNSARTMWDSLEKEGVAKRIVDEEQGDNFRVLKVDNVSTKTRRILEVQSDLFQKGRDKNSLVPNPFAPTQDDIDNGSDVSELQSFDNELQTNLVKDNQFLQLLNKDNNWVTFFVKSIVQSTAKETITEVQESDVEAKVRELEKEGLLEIDCKGKLKAEDGIATLFEKGGKWEIITDFKNAPTHKSGGKDISIQGKKVEVEKNELRIENDFGDVAVIPSKYRVEVKDAIKSNCHSCIDGVVESLPKMKDYAGDGTVFPFFGRYKRFKNSLPDNLKNTQEDDYAMRYYWKHSNKPKSFDEAINREQPMFTMEDDGYYHAPSVEPNTLRFLKPKNHPTLQYELDWYNSDNPDAVDFRSKYDLDMSGKFYKYVPKKQ